MTKKAGKVPSYFADMDKALGRAFKKAKVDNPKVTIDPNHLEKSHPFIPSGSVVIDWLIGGRSNRYGVAPCPGWPVGKISNIFGHESSGKTTVALTAAAQVCGQGRPVVFVDWEHAIVSDYARALGVPIEDDNLFRLYQPDTLEQGFQIVWAAAWHGIPLIILDSVGAGVPEAIFGQSLEEIGETGQVGLVARKWSLFLPRLQALIKKNNVHVMGLSQLRKKINTRGYGGSDTQHQGGEAWKFFSGVRMSFTRVKSEKTSEYDALLHKNVDRMTSAVIRGKMVKTKVSANQQLENTFYIKFGAGIDNDRSILDIAMAHGLVKKSGSWLSWDPPSGDMIKAQGTSAFMAAVRERGLFDQMQQLTMSYITSAAEQSPVVPLEDEDIDLGFSTGELPGPEAMPDVAIVGVDKPVEKPEEADAPEAQE